jgi:hypothetical protein
MNTYVLQRVRADLTGLGETMTLPHEEIAIGVRCALAARCPIERHGTTFAVPSSVAAPNTFKIYRTSIESFWTSAESASLSADPSRITHSQRSRFPARWTSDAR